MDRDLPLFAGTDARHARGIWEPDHELRMLNMLTLDRVKYAH